MTFTEKALLIDLIRRGKSAKEIPQFVRCSRSTIRKYMKIFCSCEHCKHFDPDRMYGMCKLTGQPKEFWQKCKRFGRDKLAEGKKGEG